MLDNLKSPDRQRIAVIALVTLLVCSPRLFALDPSLDISQYAHTTWKVGEALPSAGIQSLAQTQDGYLWLGTEFGLLRFDGVRAVLWQPPAGEHLPSDDVRSVLGARDGRLWIGTFVGLASWKDGKLTHYPELDDQVIEALLEDREGTIWVAGWAPSRGRLCKIQSGKTQCYGEDGRFGYGVTPLYEDSKGYLWAGATNGLWRWKPGPPKLYPMPDPEQRIYALAESDDGGILVAKQTGITKLRNERTERYPIPAGLQFRPLRLLRDRNGALWIGAVVDSGLLHIHQGRSDVFSRADGLSSEGISSLFEDREGNIWVGTINGLDRFREFAVPATSVQQGFSSTGSFSVVTARDGSLWFGMSNGVNRWDKGQITVYRKPGSPVPRGPQAAGSAMPIEGNGRRTGRVIFDSGLPDQAAEVVFEGKRGQIWVGTRSGVAFLKSGHFVQLPSVPDGIVYSFTEDTAGNVWISHQEGLFHLFGQRVVERIRWGNLGRKEPATGLLHDARQGGFWLGFRDGGLAYFKDGQIRALYTGGDGLGKGMVRNLYADGSGSLWASTDGGLSRVKDGRVVTLTSQNGLPCDTVHWMMEDDAGSVWLYLACGLVRIARSELDTWASHPQEKVVRPVVFDSSDGVSSHRFTGGYSATVAKSADGKLWFLRVGGVSVLDPRHLPVNKLPPPVHIEQVIADDKTYDAINGMRLHPRVRDLAIDYTALSLVIPEKVRFRYKLEGQDKDWRELVNVRHVEYTNLPPKHYRFRVLASNDSGVWNEEGASLGFVIPPAWYQTTWFRGACVAAFLVMVWAAYQLRVRQLAHQFNMRLEERVAERTRIARDLHDTLLQSFQALLLRFQTGINMLAQRPADARRLLEDAVDRASQAIAEGRDAIGGLRMSTVEKNDLVVAIKTLAEELARAPDNQGSIPFQLLVEGTTRELHPILRDEVYRLAGEALRNAFRHAAAQNVEIEIRYDKKYFRLRIRDDGKGIPSDVLSGDGAKGHYGLRGMRERAKLVGGKLTIWTELESGTEIELIIPGAIAYVKPTRSFWYFGKRSTTETDEREPIKRG